MGPRERSDGGSWHETATAARLDAIVRNAHALLMKSGYHGISLNEVMRLSGGSKSTITKYFGNKAGLLHAVFRFSSRRLYNTNPFTPTDLPWEEELLEIAANTIEAYTRPDSLVVYRGVVGEGDADMGAAFYNEAHQTYVTAIAERLEQWRKDGHIRTDDPAGDADRFTHIIRAGLYERILVGVTPAPPLDEIREAVRPAVAMFIRAVRAPTERR